MSSHVLYYTACSSTLFSCVLKNLVSRDGFGSPVPRQLFFVPSEVGSTRVRVIRSRAARLFLVRASKFGLARRFRQSRPVSAFFLAVRDRIDTGTSDRIPGRTALFLCAPKNLVSRNGLSSLVPRFFVPSEIGSTRVRAIRSRAARLFLAHA